MLRGSRLCSYIYPLKMAWKWDPGEFSMNNALELSPDPGHLPLKSGPRGGALFTICTPFKLNARGRLAFCCRIFGIFTGHHNYEPIVQISFIVPSVFQICHDYMHIMLQICYMGLLFDSLVSLCLGRGFQSPACHPSPNITLLAFIFCHFQLYIYFAL